MAQYDFSTLPDKPDQKPKPAAPEQQKFDFSTLPDQPKQQTKAERDAEIANLKKVSTQPINVPTTPWDQFTHDFFDPRKNLESLKTSVASLAGVAHGAIVDLPGSLYGGLKTLRDLANPLTNQQTAGKVVQGVTSLPSRIYESALKSGSEPYQFGRQMGQTFVQPAVTGGVGRNLGPILGAPVRLSGTALRYGVIPRYGPFSWVTPPFVRAIERAAGRGIESAGRSIATNVRVPPVVVHGAQGLTTIPEQREKQGPVVNPPIQGTNAGQGYDFSTLPDQPEPPFESGFNETIPGESQLPETGFGESPLDPRQRELLEGLVDPKKGFIEGLKDVPRELYEVINEVGRTSAENIRRGNYGQAFGDITRPIMDPFNQLMGITANRIQGKPAVPEFFDPETGRMEATSRMLGYLGYPTEGFKEAWEAEDYPRIAGQTAGALGTFYLGHRLNSRINRSRGPQVLDPEPGFTPRPGFGAGGPRGGGTTVDVNPPLLQGFTEGEVIPGNRPPRPPAPPRTQLPEGSIVASNGLTVTIRSPEALTYWEGKGFTAVPGLTANDGSQILVRNDVVGMYGVRPNPAPVQPTPAPVQPAPAPVTQPTSVQEPTIAPQTQGPVAPVQPVSPESLLAPLPEGRVSSPFEKSMRAAVAAQRAEGLTGEGIVSIPNEQLTPDVVARYEGKYEFIKQGPTHSFFRKIAEDEFGGAESLPDIPGGGVQGPMFAPADRGGGGGGRWGGRESGRYRLGRAPDGEWLVVDSTTGQIIHNTNDPVEARMFADNYNANVSLDVLGKEENLPPQDRFTSENKVAYRPGSKFDVFDPSDGIIIQTFNSEAEAQAFIDQNGANDRWDYDVHDPRFLPNAIKDASIDPEDLADINRITDINAARHFRDVWEGQVFSASAEGDTETAQYFNRMLAALEKKIEQLEAGTPPQALPTRRDFIPPNVADPTIEELKADIDTVDDLEDLNDIVDHYLELRQRAIDTSNLELLGKADELINYVHRRMENVVNGPPPQARDVDPNRMMGDPSKPDPDLEGIERDFAELDARLPEDMEGTAPTDRGPRAGTSAWWREQQRLYERDGNTEFANYAKERADTLAKQEQAKGDDLDKWEVDETDPLNNMPPVDPETLNRFSAAFRNQALDEPGVRDWVNEPQPGDDIVELPTGMFGVKDKSGDILFRLNTREEAEKYVHAMKLPSNELLQFWKHFSEEGGHQNLVDEITKVLRSRGIEPSTADIPPFHLRPLYSGWDWNDTPASDIPPTASTELREQTQLDKIGDAGKTPAELGTWQPDPNPYLPGGKLRPGWPQQPLNAPDEGGGKPRSQKEKDDAAKDAEISRRLDALEADAKRRLDAEGHTGLPEQTDLGSTKPPKKRVWNAKLKRFVDD